MTSAEVVNERLRTVELQQAVGGYAKMAQLDTIYRAADFLGDNFERRASVAGFDPDHAHTFALLKRSRR
jgi:hypothetical protein